MRSRRQAQARLSERHSAGQCRDKRRMWVLLPGFCCFTITLQHSPCSSPRSRAEQLSCPLATSGREVHGETRGRNTKIQGQPSPVQRERGREGRRVWRLPGFKGTVLQLRGLQNTWTAIRAGEGKPAVPSLPEGLTKETPDCWSQVLKKHPATTLPVSVHPSGDAPLWPVHISG